MGDGLRCGRRADRRGASADVRRAAGAFNNYRIDRIKHVVVIYAENRSFDNLYGDFPGADGLNSANASSFFRIQKDRNGSVLKVLPPVWGGLTAAGVTPVITQAQTENMPNQLFALDDANSYNVSIGVTTRDLWHRFYQNQMQIDNGGQTTSSRRGPIPAVSSWAIISMIPKIYLCGVMRSATRSQTISLWARSAARSSITNI